MKNKRMQLTPANLASTSTKPVSLRMVSANALGATVEISINYRNVEVPGRAYFADYCDVQRGRAGYSLVFGKLEPGGSALRTKIEVTYPKEMFLRVLWASSRTIHAMLEQLPLERLKPINPSTQTDKVQTFRANNVFMGIWSEDAVLDFYYMSPRELGDIGGQQKVGAELEPIVRVAMETVLLLEFLEKCRPFVEEDSAALPTTTVQVR
jgi:hypothetical protein